MPLLPARFRTPLTFAEPASPDAPVVTRVSTFGPLCLALLAAAWLIPNHYPPWLSAWSEGWALAMLFAAALLLPVRARIGLPWAAALLLALGSVTWQTLTGTILFAGDGWMAGLYIAAFGLALAVGSTLPHTRTASMGTGLDFLAVGLALAASVSVFIALCQWTGAVPLGIYAADLPPGARPFGNVGQPNHLCTLAFLGLTGLAVLHESGRVGKWVWWLGSILLVLGMVVSGSRTGWLQAAFLPLGLAWMTRRQPEARLRPWHGAVLAALFAAGTLAWPSINEATHLSGQRLDEQLQVGLRLPMWRAMADALAVNPWGWGWQQVVVAQQAVALEHAGLQRHFEHAHNIVIDLLVWAGVPVGGAIVALGGFALIQQGRRVADPRASWLFMGACGVLIHGLLELPLEYAYFLVPVGLALGACHSLAPASRDSRAPRFLLPVAGAVGGAMLLAVAMDYAKAEQSNRQLRFEIARLGFNKIESETPELRLLTQIRAFQDFARTEARQGMTNAELETMHRAVQRFAYPSALFRYALASGLNKRPEEAQRMLDTLCAMHPPQRCAEAHAGWQALELQHPELQGIWATVPK